MKRFYKIKKIKFRNIFMYVIIIVIFIDIIIFNTLGKKLGESVSFLTKLKLDEITKYYMNDTIKKYLNVDSNDYIKVNLVNNNIVSVDIDNVMCNKLLNNIIVDLESNVKNLEKGMISNYHNLEIINGDNGIIIFMPVGVSFGNSLFSGLGPKIPVKVSFLENIDAYVDVIVENYGINNSLIKLYINIDVEEVLEMPTKNRFSNVKYKFLISSKLINGEVPSVLGGSINKSSSVVNSNVK